MMTDESELEVLETMTQGMQAFANKYRLAMDDPDLRGLYYLEMSAAHEIASQLDDARTDGFEKGLEEGEEMGRLAERKDFARRMLNAKMPLDQIVEFTGLSAEQIQTLH